MSDATPLTTLTTADLATGQEVRWCPGCGDFSILAQLKKALAESGIPREKLVFVSGIGCASRFPYYLNTYGFQTMPGRALTIATGLKLLRPDLSVWVVTGDGDALSAGGNHLLHALRRNVDVKILLINNEVYGLAKGQASPTSRPGTRTRSTPDGSFENPLRPLAVALAAGATFVARTVDVDIDHLTTILNRAASHRGTAFVEIYQNCKIFNDGVFDYASDKSAKGENVLYLEHGQRLVYGNDQNARRPPERPGAGTRDARQWRRTGRPPDPQRRGGTADAGVPAQLDDLSRVSGKRRGFPQSTPADARRTGGAATRRGRCAAGTWDAGRVVRRRGCVGSPMICPTCNHDNVPGSAQCENCQHDLTQWDRPRARDRVEQSLMDDRVSALHWRKPVTLSARASVGEAIRTMLAGDIGAVLIVDDCGKLIGIFSERDLLTKIAGTADYASLPVSTFMTPRPETVRETDTLAFVLHKLDSGGYRHLPVVKNGLPVGMISVRDVLRHITRLCKRG